MIEVKSFPDDLSAWDPSAAPFYLELFGETRPVVNPQYAELVPAADEKKSSAPIYEYWWTIGHPGLPPEHKGLLSRKYHESANQLWRQLKDPAGRVYVYFPVNAGWRIKEIAASVQYLPPVRQQKSLWDEVAKEWQQIQPLVSGAGDLASKLGAIPGVGTAAAAAAPALSAIGRLKVNSVPHAEGFDWSVAKVTFGSDLGVMQGVAWTLPKQLFEVLGGRLTGSIAVSFIQARSQRAESAETSDAPKAAAVLAHAVVFGPEEPIWAPSEVHDFVRLNVTPVMPASPSE